MALNYGKDRLWRHSFVDQSHVLLCQINKAAGDHQVNIIFAVSGYASLYRRSVRLPLPQVSTPRTTAGQYSSLHHRSVLLDPPQVGTPRSTTGLYSSFHHRSVLLAPPQVGTPRSTVVQYLSLYRRPCSTPQSKWTKGSMCSANSNKNYILFQWPVTSYGLKIVNKHRQIHR